MAFLANYTKQDLIDLCYELGISLPGNPTSNMIKDFILKSHEFDEEIVENILENISKERVESEHAQKDRQAHELKLLRIQLETTRVSQPTNPGFGVDQEFYDLSKLIQYNVSEDISAFLTLFERQMKVANVPQEIWLLYLFGSLPSQVAYLLTKETAQDVEYQIVKKFLLQRLRFSADRITPNFKKPFASNEYESSNDSNSGHKPPLSRVLSKSRRNSGTFSKSRRGPFFDDRETRPSFSCYGCGTPDVTKSNCPNCNNYGSKENPSVDPPHKIKALLPTTIEESPLELHGVESKHLTSHQKKEVNPLQQIFEECSSPGGEPTPYIQNEKPDDDLPDQWQHIFRVAKIMRVEPFKQGSSNLHVISDSLSASLALPESTSAASSDQYQLSSNITTSIQILDVVSTTARKMTDIHPQSVVSILHQSQGVSTSVHQGTPLVPTSLQQPQSVSTTSKVIQNVSTNVEPSQVTSGDVQQQESTNDSQLQVPHLGHTFYLQNLSSDHGTSVCATISSEDLTSKNFDASTATPPIFKIFVSTLCLEPCVLSRGPTPTVKMKLLRLLRKRARLKCAVHLVGTSSWPEGESVTLRSLLRPILSLSRCPMNKQPVLPLASTSDNSPAYVRQLCGL